MNRSILKYSFFKKLRRMHLITDQRYHSIIRPGYEYIARSEYFNEAYFCSRYGDLFPRGQNPISYYLSGGWRDAPCTSPLFDGAKYLRRYEDARKAACPPLLHYLVHGKREKREIFKADPLPAISMHFFSVLVLCCAESPGIEETLKSLAHQNYDAYEILLLDTDASMEFNEIELIKERNSVRNLLYLRNEQKGNYVHAVLQGIQAAKGHLITFCESGDVYKYNRLEKLNKLLHLHPQARFVMNDYRVQGLFQKYRKNQHCENVKTVYQTGGRLTDEQWLDNPPVDTLSAICIRKGLAGECVFQDGMGKWDFTRHMIAQLGSGNRLYYLADVLTFVRSSSIFSTEGVRNGTEEERADTGREDLKRLLERKNYRSGLKNQTPDQIPPIQEVTQWKKHIYTVLSHTQQSACTERLRILYISTTSRTGRPIMDPSVRYRCYHPAEVLNQSHFVSVVSFAVFRQRPSYDYDVYIFHRPCRASVGIVRELRKAGKVLIADYDDLIFGNEEVALCSSIFLSGRSNAETARKIFADNLEALRQFDIFTVSTEPLAAEIYRYRPKATVSILHNFIPSSILRIARAERLINLPRDRNLLMYCPGSPSHERDFQWIEDILLRVLEKNKKLHLLLLGSLSATKSIRNHPAIFFHPLVDYWNLFGYMARAAWTIAPLEQNRFTECKSAVKFLESAVAGNLLFATPIHDMQRMAKKGATLMLPSGCEEWEESLSHLDDLDISNIVGKNLQFLQNYASDANFLREFSDFINSTPMKYYSNCLGHN